PLMRAGDSVIDELVIHRFPGLAAIARTLDQLSEPAAALRRIQAVLVGGRAFDVIHLPAREVRTTDVPFLALAVRLQNERALARADRYPDLTHVFSFFSFRP